MVSISDELVDVSVKVMESIVDLAAHVDNVL